jgi:quinol monooxygenase YgiN
MAVTEIVKVFPKAGVGDTLQKTFDVAIDLLIPHPECHGVKVYRGIEDPNSFILAVEWTSVEAHETWRASDARAKWRAMLGDFQDKPNEVGHYVVVAERS